MEIKRISNIAYSPDYLKNNNIKKEFSNRNNLYNISSLSSQAEILGRSQVSFNGITSLNNEELNVLADVLGESKIHSGKIPLIKKNIINYMNEKKLKKLSDIYKKFNLEDIPIESVVLANHLRKDGVLSEYSASQISSGIMDYYYYERYLEENPEPEFESIDKFLELF